MKDVFLVKETSILKITEMRFGLIIIFGDPFCRFLLTRRYLKTWLSNLLVGVPSRHAIMWLFIVRLKLTVLPLSKSSFDVIKLEHCCVYDAPKLQLESLYSLRYKPYFSEIQFWTFRLLNNHNTLDFFYKQLSILSRTRVA